MDIFIKKLTRNELGLIGAKTLGEIYVPMNCLDFFPVLSDGTRPECSLTIIHRTEQAFQQFAAFVTVYEKGEAHLRRMKPVLGPHVHPGDFLVLRKRPDNFFDASVIRLDSMLAAFLETQLGRDVATVLSESEVASVTSSSGATFDSLLESSERGPDSREPTTVEEDSGLHVVQSHPLADGTPPDWASEWGHDEFGPWCSFEIEDAQQVLRWIPAGQFQMGVAEEYEGLFDDDCPRHWVTLTHGFWMFDSLCSLRLFNAVMKGLPQAAASNDGAAVHLNYWTARNFCSKLCEILGGVAVALPTDAQWEFACRAGRQDGPHFDYDPEQVNPSNPWGLRSILNGTGELCWDGPRYLAESTVVDPVGHDEGVIVRGLPRMLSVPLFHGGQITDDEEPTLLVPDETHPSFREVIELNTEMSNVGFRCVIAEHQWATPAFELPNPVSLTGQFVTALGSLLNEAPADNSQDRSINVDAPVYAMETNTPLSALIRDMASHLHRYYTDLIEPAPGIETRWKLVDGNPLCEAGREVATAIPDFVLDSKGHRNFPGHGGRLWYILLRTSRRATFEDARPYLIAAARDLDLWLHDQYPNELPNTFVVGELPFSLRLANLQTFLGQKELTSDQKPGTGTGWPADQHPLLHAAIDVLVAIPDAITALDGTPNFPGVGSHLWPQLKNSVATTEDSPKQAKRRSALAQQFRDWLTNRYRTDSLEAVGVQSSVAFEKPAISSMNANESPEKQFDVYLSYNSSDKETIEPLVMEIEQRGLTVFLDTEHLSFGDDLNTVLRQAIRNSRCVVVCVSKSEIGQWQRFEIESHMRTLPDEEARQFFESTIPVLLPGAPDPKDPETAWNTQRWLDFRQGFGEVELEQLVKVIRMAIS